MSNSQIVFLVIVALVALFVWVARRSNAVDNSGEIESFDPTTLGQVVPAAPVRVPVVPINKATLIKKGSVVKKLTAKKATVKKVVKKS